MDSIEFQGNQSSTVGNQDGFQLYPSPAEGFLNFGEQMVLSPNYRVVPSMGPIDWNGLLSMYFPVNQLTNQGFAPYLQLMPMQQFGLAAGPTSSNYFEVERQYNQSEPTAVSSGFTLWSPFLGSYMTPTCPQDLPSQNYCAFNTHPGQTGKSTMTSLSNLPYPDNLEIEVTITKGSRNTHKASTSKTQKEEDDMKNTRNIIPNIATEILSFVRRREHSTSILIKAIRCQQPTFKWRSRAEKEATDTRAKRTRYCFKKRSRQHGQKSKLRNQKSSKGTPQSSQFQPYYEDRQSVPIRQPFKTELSLDGHQMIDKNSPTEEQRDAEMEIDSQIPEIISDFFVYHNSIAENLNDHKNITDLRRFLTPVTSEEDSQENKQLNYLNKLTRILIYRFLRDQIVKVHLVSTRIKKENRIVHLQKRREVCYRLFQSECERQVDSQSPLVKVGDQAAE